MTIPIHRAMPHQYACGTETASRLPKCGDLLTVVVFRATEDRNMCSCSYMAAKWAWRLSSGATEDRNITP